MSRYPNPENELPSSLVTFLRFIVSPLDSRAITLSILSPNSTSGLGSSFRPCKEEASQVLVRFSQKRLGFSQLYSHRCLAQLVTVYSDPRQVIFDHNGLVLPFPCSHCLSKLFTFSLLDSFHIYRNHSRNYLRTRLSKAI